jgi:hypothetical protein
MKNVWSSDKWCNQEDNLWEIVYERGKKKIENEWKKMKKRWHELKVSRMERELEYWLDLAFEFLGWIFTEI